MRARICLVDGKITELTAPVIIHAVDSDGELYVRAENMEGTPLRIMTLARDSWTYVDLYDINHDQVAEYRRRQRDFEKE